MREVGQHHNELPDCHILCPEAVGLVLADGAECSLEPVDSGASATVAALAAAMCLGPSRDPLLRLSVQCGNGGRRWSFDLDGCARTATCTLGSGESLDAMAVQLMWLSQSVAALAQTRGCFLLHGALAEYRGQGVILAGQGGIGKTTASHRLPPPWLSLSDDAMLVVRDRQGMFRAHPWPRGGSFAFGGHGGSWDTGHAVPLSGVFFLTWAPADLVEPLDTGLAAGIWSNSAEQVIYPMFRSMELEQRRAFRIARLDIICALVKSVPAMVLHLSLGGDFWREIERVVDGA